MPSKPDKLIKTQETTMQVQLKEDFEEVLEPLGNHAVEFFLAASLGNAHKISFAAAAALASMSFE